MSDLLPEGWTETRFAELITELRNGISTRPNIDPPGTSILRISAARAGGISLDDRRYLPGGHEHLAVYGLRDKDLLFTRYNGSIDLLGVCGMVRGLGTEPLLYPDKLMRVRVRDGVVSPEYLEAYFQSPSAREAIKSTAKSSAGQQGISGGDLKEQIVRLPPLTEQRRIVQTVEALLTEVKQTKRRLDRVPLILKRFRQSVLAAAYSGELTRDWREERIGREDPPGSRQPALASQRRQLWAGRQQGGGRRYTEPFQPGASLELPEGWEWVSVSSLALLDVGFAFKSAEFTEGGVRLLRGENVAPGSLRWTDTRYWPESKIDFQRHHSIEAGEIILALDRPIVSAGLKIARARQDDLPALLVQRVMRFKMVDKGDTDLLYFCLCDRRFVDFLAHEGMTGSDLPHITGTGVAEFPVPLPPKAEQIELVRRIEAMFTFADAIERRVRAASTQANKLPQAILSKAFSGELVPTEAELARMEGRSYETAEELLKRIAAPAAEVAPKTKARRSPRSGRSA